MNKLKHLLTTVVILGIIITGVLGILLVLDIVSLETTRDTLVKTFQIFGIITVVSGVIIGILHLNKGN